MNELWAIKIRRSHSTEIIAAYRDMRYAASQVALLNKTRKNQDSFNKYRLVKVRVSELECVL